MKVMSLFSGVGGFELGLPKHYEVIGHSEIDKYASDVLRYNYPNIKNYGDITKINWDTVPDFDLLVGGSPCQDLSVAGKRAGIDGQRSGLFRNYCDALCKKKPAYFIWENVKGVMSSNQGRDFAIILTEMAEAGYSLWWQVLNAKDFGVPQNRERIFIVGTRNGSPREILFERRENKTNIEQVNNPVHSNDRVYNPSGISPTLNTMQGGDRQPFITTGVIDHETFREREDTATTIDANYAKGHDNHGARTMVQVRRQPLRFLDRNQKNIEGDYAFTVDTTNTGGIKIARTIRVGGAKSPHGSKQNWDSYEIENRIRRLTPIECERLMSWPDDWTKYGKKEDGAVYEMSDSQRYKMCGNGVVSEVVKQLIKTNL
jgi:DNA (cytosine-5)-methyltransferase 1